MKNNPTAEKQFYKKLTKLIETGAVKFDAEPREVIAWFEKMWQQYTQQILVTDKQIDKMALKEFPIDMFQGEDINHDFRTGFEIGGKLIRDLQPKTGNWVSKVKKQIELLEKEKQETLDSFLDADILQQDILTERNMRISIELKFLNDLLI